MSWTPYSEIIYWKQYLDTVIRQSSTVIIEEKNQSVTLKDININSTDRQSHGMGPVGTLMAGLQDNWTFPHSTT